MVDAKHMLAELQRIARVDDFAPVRMHPSVTESHMADRRFNDEEIREILTRATEVRDPSPALPAPESLSDGHAHGLTLAELQDVAADVGISATRIAEAAAGVEVDRAALPATRTQLGIPISAAHVVRLPRMLEAEEWDRFVVRLRDTFGAAGTVRTEGSLRTWTNGNLEVLLEPLEKGARLRFQSMHSVSKGHLEGALAFGASGIGLVAVFGILAILPGKSVPGALIGISASLPALGAAMWAIGRSTAARWVPERRSQFEALGEEAVRSISGTAES